MSGLFYNLGSRVGPQFRRAKWIWQSMTGSKADAIKVENDVGRDLAREVRRQLKPDHQRFDRLTALSNAEGRRAEEILNKVGSRLSDCVANKLRSFSYETVESPEPNAFALPGGFIFVTRPLMELCEWSEDEIAFILGHEMAHVIRGHAMHRLISNCAISATARVAPGHGVLSAWLQKIGVQFLESAYSQELELEADRFGVRLAGTARYDERASMRLLTRLSNLNQPTGGGLNLGSYFSSHPLYDVRINNIGRVLGKRPRKEKDY